MSHSPITTAQNIITMGNARPGVLDLDSHQAVDLATSYLEMLEACKKAKDALNQIPNKKLDDGSHSYDVAALLGALIRKVTPFTEADQQAVAREWDEDIDTEASGDDSPTPRESHAG